MVDLLIVLLYFFGLFLLERVFSRIYSRNKILFCILDWLADKNNKKINPELINYYNNGGKIPKMPLLGYCRGYSFWKMPRLVSTDKQYLELVKEYRRTSVYLGLLVFIVILMFYFYGVLEEFDVFEKAFDFLFSFGSRFNGVKRTGEILNV